MKFAPPDELAQLLRPPQSFDARPAVEWLVHYASREEASDLHLRPGPLGLEVQLRHDGVLSHRFTLPSDIYARLLVGLKNLARLASYKTSVPQDGKFSLAQHEVRVATAPTQFGEKAVLRLLTQARDLLALEELGFSPAELAQLHTIVDQPQGLVLATGPAGSGKTTTLLALMRWLYNRHQRRLGPTPGAALNVVTLEDPVEIVVPEFNQTTIQPEMGMTFASGLRSILRQDPELILVGEIRDPETAAAVVQSSLTGHMVFSTVHARNSLGVIPRLLEMGAQAYPLAASLSGVIYQRLVRVLCHCRRPGEASPELRRERQELGLPEGPLWQPEGCQACQQTGYQGRQAIPEVLVVDEALRDGILSASPLSRLEESRTGLRQRALERVAQGLTSYEEVCRVIPRK